MLPYFHHCLRTSEEVFFLVKRFLSFATRLRPRITLTWIIQAISWFPCILLSILVNVLINLIQYYICNMVNLVDSCWDDHKSLHARIPPPAYSGSSSWHFLCDHGDVSMLVSRVLRIIEKMGTTFLLFYSLLYYSYPQAGVSI